MSQVSEVTALTSMVGFSSSARAMSLVAFTAVAHHHAAACVMT